LTRAADKYRGRNRLAQAMLTGEIHFLSIDKESKDVDIHREVEDGMSGDGGID
jgi:hypothetical protein